jgi:cholesterol transport system auxiliary component
VTTHRAVLCVVLALGLGACVSLFPAKPPAQLYRFGVGETPAGPPSSAAMFNVSRMPTGFVQAAEGDRILTVNGTEAAYIAQARWDEPASMLFNDAETEAFERAGGPARLLRAGDAAASSISLRLEVQTFEARYTGDGKAPPSVVVVVRAVLANPVERKIVGDEVFESRKPASENRVEAIVEAFGAATSDVLNQIVGWTERQGAAAS